LGWEPEHDAESTLTEMLEGIADAAGAATPVMVGGVRSFGHMDSAAMATATPDVQAPQLPAETERITVPDHIDASLLGLYLSDHITGATAGKDRIRQMVVQYGTTRIGPELATISKQIEGEHAFLTELINVLDVNERNPRQLLGAAAERVGRLKLNQRVVE